MVFEASLHGLKNREGGVWRVATQRSSHGFGRESYALTQACGFKMAGALEGAPPPPPFVKVWKGIIRFDAGQPGDPSHTL